MLSTQAYNTIVKLYSDRVYRYVLKAIRGDEASAKDIVQNTFMKLWTRRDKVEAETIKGLLFKMAHQQIIDTYRKDKARREREIISVETNSISSNRYDQQQQLDIAFSHLTEMHRSLVLLRDYEGYGYEEIANMLSLSLSQVKVYLFRARKQLKQIIVQLENELI